MKVRKAMHQGVVWVSPETTVAEIARTMQENDIGAVPVGENDRLVGMVTDRDIVCRGVARGKDPTKLAARDVMTPGILYCRDDEDIEEAMERMEEKKIRRLPVIDEKKRMVGMLSLGDVSHAAPDKPTVKVVKAVSAHHR